MSKEFIPYEEARALKELGFDELCLMNYGGDECLYKSGLGHDLKAPLYQQAFRWFREVHSIKNVHIHESRGFYIKIEMFIIEELFNTYEEAELYCLRKLIEIVKQR